MAKNNGYLDPQQVEEWKSEKLRIKEMRKALPLLRRIHSRPRRYVTNIKMKTMGIIGFTGDWHTSHKNFREDWVEEDIALACKHKIPVVLMGDLFENYNLKTAGMKPNDNTMDLDDQKEMVLEFAESFKSVGLSNLILGVILGNHSERSLKTDGFNYPNYLAKYLNVNYLGRWGRININTPKGSFGMFVAHKWKGSSIYNIFHPCVRARFEQPHLAGTARVVAIAHNHVAGAQEVQGTLNIRSGCYVEHDDYADQLGYGRAQHFFPAIVYDMKKNRVKGFTEIRDAVDQYNIWRKRR